jgi:hypothetical protein
MALDHTQRAATDRSGGADEDDFSARARDHGGLVQTTRRRRR